jgi:thiamine biosynthesis lipoprotein
VRVTSEVFHLLQHAYQLWEETEGAFDITVGPLVRCWGFMGGTGQMPEPDALSQARSKVGMNLVHLDAGNLTVRFDREGVMLDLGAIGKGYAVGRAVELLREAGITSALIHGGTSTIYAIGRPPADEAWKVAIERPTDTPDAPSAPIAIVSLRNEALSVSAVWGKSFQTADKRYGHVIDPRTGHPTQNALFAAVQLPSATETDALSTALLALGSAGQAAIRKRRPEARTLVISHDSSEELRIEANGIPGV